MGDTRGMLKPGGRPTTLVWTQREEWEEEEEEEESVVGGTSFKIAVNIYAKNNESLVCVCERLIERNRC